MAAITYTAKSRAPLITDSPAHVAGTDYSFDIKLNAYNTSIETPKNQVVSMGGQVETTLYGVNKIANIKLGPFEHADLQQIEEFIYSIADGHAFQFDPWGSVASADNPLQVKATANNYDEERITHGQAPLRYITMVLRLV